MGGAVSSGESNDDLIDNLLEADYIKSPLVERVFRAVDRAFYYTEPYKQNAYKDLAWKDGNLHLSAPCIYSEVLENLELGEGMCFLNIGSGTGYFSTMCGLIIGNSGVNHGIELYPDVANYARMKLEDFIRTSPAVDEFDFCPPVFTVGNCLDAIPASKRYDRIYCGAACPNTYVGQLIDMLKIGGICVVPLGDSLVQITRTEEKKDERKALLPVSFASLISPKDGESRIPVELPEWCPKSLTEICRVKIRSAMRQTISLPEPTGLTEENRKKKRKRRQVRRRASRLVVVQRRRSGGEVGNDNGFVAIAYSMGSNSSDEDRRQQHDQDVDSDQNPNGPNESTISTEAESSHEASPHTGEPEEEEENEVESSIQEGATMDTQKQSDLNGPKLVGAAADISPRNGVAVVTGNCPIVQTANGKKIAVAVPQGARNSRSEEPRSADAVSTRSRPAVNGNNRPTRSARNYTTGAEALFGRIRELVRARQHDLESMRRQFQRNDNDTERVNAGAAPNGSNLDQPDLTSSSDSSPSPSVSATSTSDDENGGGSQSDSSKKRCRNESSDDEKGLASKDPKPDPLIINPCSVQMRKKILELPLPPALKVYLNFDRKLNY